MKILLDYRFKDQQLQQQALTHPSYINEADQGRSGHYQRLEFLGDALLGLLLAELLYQRYPELPEGELSRLRSTLVDQDCLAKLARQHGLAPMIKLGKGAEQEGGRDNPSILSDIFEAMVAAVYLDAGFNTVKTLVEEIYHPLLAASDHNPEKWIDAKSRLQELMAVQKQPAPTYQLIEQSGPEHGRIFVMQVKVGDKILGCGQGRSKKSAQQAAAKEALAGLLNSAAVS